MSQFPEGLEVAAGRFQLSRLLRGMYHDGLWSAVDRERDRNVWVTLRSAPHTPARAQLLGFHAFGVPAPLYIGPPDMYVPGGERVRDAHFCVVDEIPGGEELAELAALQTREAIQLGIDLCNLVATWAPAPDGYILRGLRPETIFLSADDHRFVGATPRPYFLLGNQNEFDAYPSLSFDPPTLGPAHITRHDAVFTVALLIWWSATHVHPYVIRGTDTEQNQLEDRRLPFTGDVRLGAVLERGLIADLSSRIDVSQLREQLNEL
jgi:hypothetical protein